MKKSIGSMLAAAGFLAGFAWGQNDVYAAEDPPLGIILAAGDISTCGDDEAWKQNANKTADIIKTVLAEASAAKPAIAVKVLALGDLAYGKGKTTEFVCFSDRWKGFDDSLLPVPGNHEYKTAGAAPYFKRFKDNPFVQQNGERAGYFALNFPDTNGPWLLIGLNGDIEGDNAMTNQLTWLEERLASSHDQQRCVLAFWHAPTFTSGRHGHDYKPEPGAPLTKERPMQRALQILYDHGASVVLAGHDHDYEQFTRHDAQGNAAADGIRSFVVGTGGSILQQDEYVNLAPNSEGGPFGRTKGSQGVLKMTVFADRFEWDFLSIDKALKLPLKTVKDDCVARKKP